jgi:hypothetical protein
MDHSLKSVVLLQDQLLQIFFEHMLNNRAAPFSQEKVPEILNNHIHEDLIKETKREANGSVESNQLEVHNVFEDKHNSLESVLSQKETDPNLGTPKKQAESEEEEAEFHDIYETRESKNVIFPVKKQVNINLKENMIIENDQTPKSKFDKKQHDETNTQSGQVRAGQVQGREGREFEYQKITDRLTILVIGYHNFAVELEYLGKWSEVGTNQKGLKKVHLAFMKKPKM